jgi:hypothetical protein
MDIQIRFSIEEAVAKLKAMPEVIDVAIRNAIRRGLNTARSAATKAIRKTYSVIPAYLRSAMGKPVIQGLSGILKVTGRPLPLQYFAPSIDRYPSGVQIGILRSSTARIPHAFKIKHPRGAGRASIFERVGPGPARDVLRQLVGPAVPTMINQRNEDEITQAAAEAAEKQLLATVNALLSGALVFKGGRIRRADLDLED